MNIRARLSRLEGADGSNKPAVEMTDAELERYIRHSLGLPSGAPITDEMLQSIINGETAGIPGK